MFYLAFFQKFYQKFCQKFLTVSRIWQSVVLRSGHFGLWAALFQLSARQSSSPNILKGFKGLFDALFGTKSYCTKSGRHRKSMTSFLTNLFWSSKRRFAYLPSSVNSPKKYADVQIHEKFNDCSKSPINFA